MKNKQIIVNAVLAVAVVVLFALQFSGGSGDTEPIKVEPQNESKAEQVVEEDSIQEEEALALDSLPLDLVISNEQALSFPVAYVDMSKLQTEFKYFDKKVKRTLSQYEAKRKGLETDLKDFEKKYQTLISDVQNGLVTEEEAGAMQAQMQPVYMNLQEKSAQIDKEFQEAQQKLILDANSKISKYLENNSDRLKYSMVIGNSEIGAVVLYSKDSLNITDQMITGLNKAYK